VKDCMFVSWLNKAAKALELIESILECIRNRGLHITGATREGLCLGYLPWPFHYWGAQCVANS